MTKYTTIAGDMWDGIAYKTLGDEAYTDKLMKQNPEYRRLFLFPAGIVLTIPISIHAPTRGATLCNLIPLKGL